MKQHFFHKLILLSVLSLSFSSHADGFWGGSGVEPVNDAVYKEECSSCHMAYQPGLLPSGSWEYILSKKGLENHYGENAELDEKTRQHILEYALNNAADKSNKKRSRKIMRSLRHQLPKRITAIPYIRYKHDEVFEAGIVGKNRKIKSISQCDQCHQTADKGVFDEDFVRIPNFRGEWDD